MWGQNPSLSRQPLAPAWCCQPLCHLWGSQEVTEQEQRHGEEDRAAQLWLPEVSTWTRQEEAIFRSNLQAGPGQQVPGAAPAPSSSVPLQVQCAGDKSRHKMSCTRKRKTQLINPSWELLATRPHHGSLGWQLWPGQQHFPHSLGQQELASSGKTEMERLL